MPRKKPVRHIVHKKGKTFYRGKGASSAKLTDTEYKNKFTSLYSDLLNKTSNQYWKSKIGSKYEDFIGRTQTTGLYPGDESHAKTFHAIRVGQAIRMGIKVKGSVVNSVRKSIYSNYLKDTK